MKWRSAQERLRSEGKTKNKQTNKLPKAFIDALLRRGVNSGKVRAVKLYSSTSTKPNTKVSFQRTSLLLLPFVVAPPLTID